MTQPAKFLFTYDKGYDRDIHELIEGIPPKRRSQRLRDLIRAGMAWEKANGQSVSRPFQAPAPPSSSSGQTAALSQENKRPSVPRFTMGKDL